jgi:ATP-dependent protease ClpP protease subunit
VLLQMPFDLFNYLLRQRIIFLAGYVNDKVGYTLHSFLPQLVFLADA